MLKIDPTDPSKKNCCNRTYKIRYRFVSQECRGKAFRDSMFAEGTSRNDLGKLLLGRGGLKIIQRGTY